MAKNFLYARWLLVGLVWLSLSTTTTADHDVGHSAFEQGDYVMALKEWKPTAESGDSQAQFNLGVMYDFGFRVVEDDVSAARWYRKAAEQGHPDAQFNLGSLYDVGSGVAVDKVKSQKWLERAAAQGHADARATQPWEYNSSIRP